MIKLVTALVALALSLPVMTWAQNSDQQGKSSSQAQQQEANEAAGSQVAGTDTSPHHTATGMVSDNGKTFTSDNTVWHVSNAGALKDYDGQNVTVRYQFNPDKNTIRITKVESAGK